METEQMPEEDMFANDTEQYRAQVMAIPEEAKTDAILDLLVNLTSEETQAFLSEYAIAEQEEVLPEAAQMPPSPEMAMPQNAMAGLEGLA